MVILTHAWYTTSSNNVIKNIACGRFADTAVNSAGKIFTFNLLSSESDTLQAPFRDNIHNGYQISALWTKLLLEYAARLSGLNLFNTESEAN